jgi:hypothetical protein
VLEGSGKYRAHGLFTGDATILSPQLTGLEFPVDALFLPPDLVAALRNE